MTGHAEWAAPSFAQERLWVTEAISPGNPVRNLRFAADLVGRLDLAALTRAVQRLVERHEVLRTYLAVVDGAVSQIVLPRVEVPLSVVDVDDPGEWAAAQSARPFELGVAPHIRVAVGRTGPQHHLLLVTVHHVAADAWSWPVLLRDLSDGYTGATRERPLIQYADYAAWQRHADNDSGLAYWRSALAGLPAFELPPDRPRPTFPTHRGAALRRTFEPELAEVLRAHARREGVSLFMVLLTAFGVVLARWARQQEVVLGTASANRGRHEVHDLVGFFVNLLVLRVDLTGARTFRESLHRVARTCVDAYDHQDVPFERVVDELGGDRDLSRHPLFQVVFQLLDGFGAELRIPGIESRPVPVVDSTAPFDLLCTVEDSRDALSCELRYATDLFDHDEVQRLWHAWHRVLVAVAADLDTDPFAVPVLSGADQAMLTARNDTVRPLPTSSVDTLVRAQATRYPDRPALTDGTTTLTYTELVARADGLAHVLRRAGVRPDDPVGVHLDRSVDLVVAMLAVLAAGGGYVVLDPGYPAARLELMVQDLGIEIVVGRAGIPGTCAVSPDVAPSQTPVQGLSSADGLANVVFTSGSTGRPKAVGVVHRAVARLVVETDYVDLRAGDVVLHLGDPSFDLTTFEVWGALATGALLYVLPGGPSGLDDVERLLSTGVPTVLSLTATLFHQIADADPGAFTGLRHLFVVGEVMDPERTRTVVCRGGPTLHNGYGPTENTTFTTVHRIDGPADVATDVPLGAAIANTTLHVLDERLLPVPPGVVGELHVGGAGLARGYLGRAALTAERFLPHPDGPPGARLYRTGDLVRWGSDGLLRFIGRVDDQVKVRGHRIEPEEVRRALRACPGVRDCAVRVMEVDGDRRLAAYVVPAAEELDAAAVLTQLRATLPPYLVPGHIVPISALPITSSGKLDAAALPGVAASARLQPLSRAPRTAVEADLWRIWAEALHLTTFGVHDDFFALGGHSLLATVVVAGVRERFGVDLPLRVLFEAPTIAGLALRLPARDDQLDDLVAELERLPTEGRAQ